MKFLNSILLVSLVFSLPAQTYFPYHEKKDPTHFMECMKLQAQKRTAEENHKKVDIILHFTPVIVGFVNIWLYARGMTPTEFQNTISFKSVIAPFSAVAIAEAAVRINDAYKNNLIKKYQDQIDEINLRKSTDIEVK